MFTRGIVSVALIAACVGVLSYRSSEDSFVLSAEGRASLGADVDRLIRDLPDPTLIDRLNAGGGAGVGPEQDIASIFGELPGFALQDPESLTDLAELETGRISIDDDCVTFTTYTGGEATLVFVEDSTFPPGSDYVVWYERATEAGALGRRVRLDDGQTASIAGRISDSAVKELPFVKEPEQECPAKLFYVLTIPDQ